MCIRDRFYAEDGVFDIEKKESIKTLILTLWKRDDEAPKRSEEVALSNAVSAYIERITGDRSVTQMCIRDRVIDVVTRQQYAHRGGE